ncbi:MAG: hypothetical protein R2719_10025 [Micropruina sp.]
MPLARAIRRPLPPRNWPACNPEAAARWETVRPAVVELAERIEVPVENLVSPEALRRVLWEPPARTTAETIDAALAAELVRPWQRELLVPVIVRRLSEA